MFIVAGCGPAITPGAGSEDTGSSTSEPGSSTEGTSAGGSSTTGTSSSLPGSSTVTSAGSTSPATQTGETGETSGGAQGCFADAFSEPAHGELVYDDGGLIAAFEGCDEQRYVFEQVKLPLHDAFCGCVENAC